jgi:hypothetical protein
MAQQITLTMTPEILRASIREHESREPTEQEVQELWEFGQDTSKYKIVIPDEAGAHLGQALPIALELVRFFRGRHWVVLEFDEPLLPTGDEPVALVGRSQSPGHAGGLADAPEIVFATDPRHALVMVRPDLRRADGRKRAPRHVAAVINRHVAFRCHRFVVQMPGTNLAGGLGGQRPRHAE